MDKIRKNQIYRIIIGIISILIGICLIPLGVDRIIASLVGLFGVTFLIGGIRYKARVKMKLEGEERKAYLRSAPFIIILIGTITLFTGLGAGLLASYVAKSGIMSFWCLGIAGIGMLLMFAGVLVKAADKK
jgi:hypothetical protein